MRIVFWGVRGSIPVPGRDTIIYGGNTTCLEVRAASGELIIIDSGMGIFQLGRSLMQKEFGQGRGKATILLTHTHWDHIQGFPFFPPLYVEGNEFQIYGQSHSERHLEGILEGQLNPNYSPILTLKNMNAKIEVHHIKEEHFQVGSLSVHSAAMTHATSQSLGYRFEENGRVFTFLTDLEYETGEPISNALLLADGADYVVHDTMFTDEEYHKFKGWGHSTLRHGIRLALQAGAKRLIGFHHAPDRRDAPLKAMYENTDELVRQEGGQDLEATPACEGHAIDLDGSTPGSQPPIGQFSAG